MSLRSGLYKQDISDFRKMYSSSPSAERRLMMDRLEGIFPTRENWYFINVYGDGRCLIHALNSAYTNRSQREEVPTERDFAVATREYFEWFSRTNQVGSSDILIQLPELGEYIITLSRGMSDNDLEESWNLILMNPQNLPTSILPILQFAYKTKIVHLNYDEHSGTKYHCQAIDNYENKRTIEIDGDIIETEDIVPITIILNNSGHYYLIDTENTDAKLTIIERIQRWWRPIC